MIERPRWIAVGRVTRAHGVRGEVSVLRLSEVASRFEPRAKVFLDESAERALTVSASRPHRGRLLVTFEEVPDRTTAELLVGRYLFLPAEAAPSLPDGSYWAHQLVGCRVLTEGGRDLGRIREVVHGQANDVWIAAGEGPAPDEVLIPALRSVVASVDVAAGTIVVRDVPGLTAP